jgi:hypothetical protein
MKVVVKAVELGADVGVLAGGVFAHENVLEAVFWAEDLALEVVAGSLGLVLSGIHLN